MVHIIIVRHTAVVYYAASHAHTNVLARDTIHTNYV